MVSRMTSETSIALALAFPYAFFLRNREVRGSMVDHRRSKCLQLFFTLILSPQAGSAGTGISSRFERIWILHSGNNTLRDVVNLSSASESPVKMIILSTFKLLSASGSVAFQILRVAKQNQVGQNNRVPPENS